MPAVWTMFNFISALLAVVIAVSVLQGIARGATGSARHLLFIVTEGAVTVASLYFAWQGAKLLSPQLQTWLAERSIQIPTEAMGFFKQLYYTFVTAFRDFPLLRFGALFLIGYVVLKHVLYLIADPLLRIALPARFHRADERRPSLSSALAGGAIGAVTGFGRALLLVAGLFIFVTLFPHTPLSGYIQGSQLYQKGAKQVIEPFTGDLIASQLPVFTRAVEREIGNIMQRKYEVIDAAVPTDVAEAAKEVTAPGKTDEEKAKLLYKWVGSRISYDWNKVRDYEERGVWHEQTPEDTFHTRKGVCIDYARLYYVMAKAAGLDAKVVTGLGYDGQGGYGPHAWNEVYLREKSAWVPLDPTWYSSGGNWFNPPKFAETHVREA
ncbi:cysteine protease [Gordoniibacillus kamchatkensis]|uniref:Cysteine protease n=1 Tax=Gordoniibacillus kamchatkensis TaxID=1590651 RepID=A0ABR5AN71_9BACL|nr:transglutaminase domain-containing protein [Paenibacillus sp. VKM B-2647]KIL42410.1 cysteine protease [Paenibacillus sp. VKM B-2647]